MNEKMFSVEVTDYFRLIPKKQFYRDIIAIKPERGFIHLVQKDHSMIRIAKAGKTFCYKAFLPHSPDLVKRVQENSVPPFRIKSRPVNGRCIYAVYIHPAGNEMTFVMDNDDVIENYVPNTTYVYHHFEAVLKKMSSEVGQNLAVND